MELELVPPGLDYTNTLIALWNALLYVGGFIGCCIYGPISSRYGRRIPLALAAVCVIVGGALQAGEVHPAMLAVARVITGLGSGSFLSSCPLYQAEVAPAHARGLVIGLHAGCVGTGFMLAQWMGAAFFYASGQASWRVPLALQCVSPIALLCVVFFLPESPRWRKSSSPLPMKMDQVHVSNNHVVYMNGQAEESERTLVRLHQDKADLSNSFAHNEFLVMKAQIDLEAEEDQSLLRCIRDPHLRKRFIIGILAASASQATGAIVILSECPEPRSSQVSTMASRSRSLERANKSQPTHPSFIPNYDTDLSS
jgi:MFS family permease